MNKFESPLNKSAPDDAPGTASPRLGSFTSPSPFYRRTMLPILLCIMSIGGCSQRLDFQDDYFIRQPGDYAFAFQRTFPNGSFVRGQLHYRITDVFWGDLRSAGDSYRVTGTASMNGGGTATTADSAFAISPIAQLKSAMEPANVSEVFIEHKPDLPGVQGTYTEIEIRRNKLRSLKLPLDFTLAPVKDQPFIWALRGEARDMADEVALVWLKDLLLRWPLFGSFTASTFALTAIHETPQQLELRMRREYDGGIDLITLRFQRNRSLVEVEAQLADGSKLSVTRLPLSGT